MLYIFSVAQQSPFLCSFFRLIENGHSEVVACDKWESAVFGNDGNIRCSVCKHSDYNQEGLISPARLTQNLHSKNMYSTECWSVYMCVCVRENRIENSNARVNIKLIQCKYHTSFICRAYALCLFAAKYVANEITPETVYSCSWSGCECGCIWVSEYKLPGKRSKRPKL